MKHLKGLLAALAILIGLGMAPAFAQTTGSGCINSGVNGVPQPGQNCLIETGNYTYAATAVALVPASAATDVACITGSPTKVVRVNSIRVGGTAGTLFSNPVFITKHASVDTGGTVATGTALPVPYKVDSGDAAPTASTSSFTANPTINDANPGIIDSAMITLNTSAATGGPSQQFNYFTHIYSEPPTLRGIAQQICVNLNGTTISVGALDISFFWTEQPL